MWTFGGERECINTENDFFKLMALTLVTEIRQLLKMDLVCQMVLIHYLEVLRPNQCFL